MSDWETLEATILACQRCPRLVAWRQEVARVRKRAFANEAYWGRPVPGFGDRKARVLVIGLAPAAHGANRTGRTFTGDSSGDFLYSALYRAGFASQPLACHRTDGMQLWDLYISGVCRCAPPANLPSRGEIVACAPYLAQEVELLSSLRIVVALGYIAFGSALKLLGAASLRDSGRSVFGHGRTLRLGRDRPWLVSSYHPSRQNTQTGRLTVARFDEIWQEVRRLLQEG